MKKLLGRWNAKAGSLSFALRCEQKAGGKYSIFIEDPKSGSQSFKDLMVVKTSMTGSDLSLRTPFWGPEIIGHFNFFGNRITGNLKVMEADSPPRYNTTPLTMIKE